VQFSGKSVTPLAPHLPLRSSTEAQATALRKKLVDLLAFAYILIPIDALNAIGTASPTFKPFGDYS
jgi:hypothetical protein